MTQFDYFKYRDDKLFCEEQEVKMIAEKQGTPLYIYSYHALVDQYTKFSKAFKDIDHLICFAVKANTNAAIMKTFFELGAGADVVSSGEMRRALKAGCDPKKIVFSGVGKTSEEIHLALQEGIYQFNVESEQELMNIERIAKFLDFKASIAIRVNPNVDPKTHPYISTGLKKNKFGVSESRAVELYEKAAQMKHIEIQGIGCHIGSQITELQPFTDAMGKIRDLVLQLREKGITIKTIDMGGGLGIRYDNEEDKSPSDYASAVLEPLKDLNCRIIMEPGRFLTGNAGIFVTKVVYLKKGEDDHHFTIVDGAFNDLMRPMLYQAYHEINPVEKMGKRKTVKSDIVGPICETTDSFATSIEIKETAPGEYLAIMSTGAYGASMASTYNSRGRPAEIMVKDKEFYIIKKPDRLEDIIEKETLPEFLKEKG